MYLNLRKGLPKDSKRNADSVHYLMIPEVDQGAIDENVELRVQRLQQTIELGRKAREVKNLKTKVRYACRAVFSVATKAHLPSQENEAWSKELENQGIGGTQNM